MWRSAYKKITYSVHAVLLEVPRTAKYRKYWHTRGTAFAIIGGSQPFLMTNAHVVCDDQGKTFDNKRLALSVFFPNLKAAIAGVAVRYIFKELDIAILEASKEAHDILPVDFSGTKLLEVGTSIASVGFPIPPPPKLHPGGGSLIVCKRLATGFVSGAEDKACFDRESENLLLYELNMLSYPGISGAPVFDIDGYVVGMNRGGIQFKENPSAYAYAIRAPEIINYLTENKIPFKTKSPIGG